MSSGTSSDSDSEWTKERSPPKRMRKVLGGCGGALSASASILSEDERKSKNSSTFIHKVYEMATCRRHSHAIGFSEDGLSLEIRNGALLGPVLSGYFRHQNVSSFIRQLNNYAFKTISSPSSGNDRHVFAHPNFRRDDKQLLELITRKAAMREKKKSKADVIKELQQRESEQRSRMIQLEARHRELLQRTMLLDAENRNLRAMFQAKGEKMPDYSSPYTAQVTGGGAMYGGAYEYDYSPREATTGTSSTFYSFESIGNSPNGTNPNSPVFTDPMQQLYNQGQIPVDHLSMDIEMSHMNSTSPDSAASSSSSQDGGAQQHSIHHHQTHNRMHPLHHHHSSSHHSAHALMDFGPIDCASGAPQA